jgi:hypothetical protein
VLYFAISMICLLHMSNGILNDNQRDLAE